MFCSITSFRLSTTLLCVIPLIVHTPLYACKYLQKLVKYCTNIVQIQCKYCANIVQILSKYSVNIEQILCKYCANIVQILCKYCTNIVQILFKCVRVQTGLHNGIQDKTELSVTLSLSHSVKIQLIINGHFVCCLELLRN